MSPEERRTDQEDGKIRPDTENPEEGPTMTAGGAMPSGSEMSHWNTAMPNPDATKPETMPNADPEDEEAKE